MGILSSIGSKAIQEIPNILGKVFLGVIIFLWIYILIRIIVSKIEKKIIINGETKDNNREKNAELIGKIIFSVLMIFNVLITFEAIWFDASIIIWWISLSIWFSMQSTIENFISGILILTNKKIEIGAFIQFLEPIEIMGVVEEISLRYTVIRTFDKRRTIIPNSIVAKTPIKTLKSEPVLRGEIPFLVPRHTPIEILKTKFIEAINKDRNIIYPEQTNIIISGFTNAGIELKGIFFVNPAKKSPAIVARGLRIELFKSMKQFGIKVPYPHISLTTE